MASSVSSIITFFIFLQFFTLSISKPLILPLKHTLTQTLHKNTPHLLKSTTTHSTSRLHHHRHHHVSLPLTPGSDYTLSFSLGSQIISLYMDTGSNLVWLPCTPFTCILCEGKYDPKTIANPRPLNLTSATPITCKSRACMSVHSSRSTSNLCAIANCPLEDIETSDCDNFSCPNFYFAYADGSFVGKLYNDNLEIPFSSPKLNIQNFTFGCAHTALGEPIGVAGFGRGALSMTSQLANTFPEIGNHFSYCLVSHSFDQTRVRKQSPLILGRYFSKKESENGEIDDVVSKDMVFTPMLENPKHPYFYCVGLEGISLGRTRIESPQSLKEVDSKGNGGMVVDSGTTFTMLPAKFHENVVAEFRTGVDKVYNRASHIEENTGLSPCYYINDDISVPKLVLHFGGNSSVAMPRKNYFYEFIDGGDDGKRKRKVGCLMLINGGDEAESSGPAGLLGNYFQQGFEVVYDLEEKKLGFARRKCSSLWDRLKGSHQKSKMEVTKSP